MYFLVVIKNKPKKILSLISIILIIAMSQFFGGVKAEAATSGQAVVSYAKQFLGRPYVYGASGPNSFDCSGLTSYVYKNAAGINIGRTTYDQIKSGLEVSRSNLQPGDLVFTSANHVGIYVGDNKIIHSPQTGDVVKISNISSFWRARRIINSSSTANNTTSNTGKSEQEIMPICNASFYSWKYQDLKNAFGTNSTSLYNHYMNYGINEGRIASETFDVVYYLNHNQDLINAFGRGNYKAAYNHFITYGYKEGRDLSPIFNMSYYLNNNPDVKAAYGNNYLGVMYHFLVCGMREGRVASPNFNVQTYKSRYADLRAAYGENNALYYDHYLIYVMYEGRAAN